MSVVTAIVAAALAAGGDCSERGTLALESARDARAIANDLHRMRAYYHEASARSRERRETGAAAETITTSGEPTLSSGAPGRWGLTMLGWYDQFRDVPACVDGRGIRTSLSRGWSGVYAYDDRWHASRWGVEAYFLAAGDALLTGDDREIPFRQRLFGGSFWWSQWIAFSAGLTLDLPPTGSDLARLTPFPRVRDSGLNLYLSLGVPHIGAFVDVVSRPDAGQVDLATVSSRGFPLGVEALQGFASVGYVKREDKAILLTGIRLEQWARAEVSFEGTPVGVRSVALRFEPHFTPGDEARAPIAFVVPFIETSLLGSAWFRQTMSASWTPGVRAGVATSLESSGMTLGAAAHLGLNSHEELARVPALLGAFQWGFRLSLSLRLEE